jgi:hypothetical protein
MKAELDLASVRECLEGVLPAVISTCAADGIPNVTYLSKVTYVDPEHVALSNQFFSKTVDNLRQNPQAQLILMHPVTGQHLRFDVLFERSETSGTVFEQVRAEIDAIASMMKMQDVFRLRAVAICRVVRGEFVPCDLDA